GIAEQPCIVLQQKQETIVVLQGGDYNERQVQKFLEHKNISRISLLIDLRKVPRDSGILAHEVINVSKQQKGTAQSQQICDIIASELRLSDGGLFVADIMGYKVALATGTCPLDTPLKVDLLLAGEIFQQGICAETTAVCGRFDWQNNGQTVYYAPNGFIQMIRPGFSAQCYGG
ncbi:DNA internalization competence protein, ComEC/Rec2 family, partial [gut metagenome]